jgi:hypothetical protein
MEKFMEMSKTPSLNITNNTTNNNTVNNQFNLNLFLNEKCKNALNMVEFIDSLEVQVSDLVHTGKVGFVEGITTILLNKMGELDVYQRPLHCTDAKREVVYIKHENAWEKENNEKTKIKKMIKHISIRNAKQVGEWTKKNKGYNDSANKTSDKYLKIVSEANSGDDCEINKIISNITPQIIIEK